MTQDEILGTLRQVIAYNQQFTTWTISTPHIVELVRIYVEQERDACARMCEMYQDTSCGLAMADAIRARGEQ